MTADEYWLGDPQMLYNYQEVYVEKLKNDRQNNWEIGLCVRNALCTTPIIAVLGNRETIDAMPDYPDCPYIDNPKPKSSEIDEEEEAEIQRILIMQNLNKVVELSEKQKKIRGGETNG